MEEAGRFCTAIGWWRNQLKDSLNKRFKFCLFVCVSVWTYVSVFAHTCHRITSSVTPQVPFTLLVFEAGSLSGLEFVD